MINQQHLEVKQDITNLRLEALKLCNSLAHLVLNVNDPKLEKRNLFKLLLERHDWSFEYSDCNGSYKEGLAQQDELRRMMRGDEELTNLYNNANPFKKI